MSDAETLVRPVAALKGPTVLLVDDEPSVLSALRRLFRTQGYRIEQATSGAEALTLMRDQPIDLVISDMRMPEMDGAAFLETVRERHPATMRLLLTGYADIGSTVAAINRGEIHRYIAKPWDDQDMLLVVGDALKRRELEQQNASLMALTQVQNQELQSLNGELGRVNQELQDLNQTLETKVADRTRALAESNALLELANEEVNDSFTMALTVFSGLLELRQDGIAGHARRVGELARRMAEKLGLDEREQREVHLGALLHDIGKLGFEDSMLGKPVSQYGPDETMRYRMHPQDGETALMPLNKLHGVALIVRQHHERVDGRGFPDGLYGPSIAVGAKIVAVASDYDGLTSGAAAEFVYTADKARAAIRDGLGTHYELRVVNALFEVLTEIEAEAIADVELEVSALRPRMVLSTDLLSTQGAILLPKGYRFDAAVIKKVNDFAARTSVRLTLRVLRKSIEPLPPGKPGAAIGAGAGAAAAVAARKPGEHP